MRCGSKRQALSSAPYTSNLTLTRFWHDKSVFTSQTARTVQTPAGVVAGRLPLSLLSLLVAYAALAGGPSDVLREVPF